MRRWRIFNCADPACIAPGALLATASDSSFHVGIAVGAGVEYALTANWILRGEYLHLDLGTKDATVKTPAGALFANAGDNPIGFRASSTATAEIARVGVSYKIW
jgi:outer membrane immunogenic protein